MLPSGISVFPGMLLNFDVERPMSVAALNAALAADQLIFLVAQKDITKDQPGESDIYKVGTICRQAATASRPSVARVMVEGICRAKLIKITSENPAFMQRCSQ